MTNERSTLIVPVESQVRELDAKILLAAAAAERGFPVILGSRAHVHHQMASFQRGVYLAKSMRKLSDRMFDIVRKLGHHIAAWDEEALVRFPDDAYYRERLSARAMGDVNVLLAWGEDDARALRAFPGYSGSPIHVAGNSRIDLLRPELRAFFGDEVHEIRRRFGEFVLVNTNFSWVNHFYKNLSQKEQAEKNREQADSYVKGRSAHKAVLFEHFQKAIPALSEALPNMTVVVRPHPAENHDTWKEAARGLPNVRVVHEGSVVPWLMAARALVHNGCTTSIEAAVLGKPSVSYQPVKSEAYDDHLPNSLSHEAGDLKELQLILRGLVEGEIAPHDEWRQRRLLDPHLAAIDGRLAADRLVDVLEEAGYLAQPPPRPNAAGYVHAWTHVHLRTAVKRFNMRRPGHRNNLAYHQHRFPGTSVSDIANRIRRFEHQLGRFQDLRIAQISEHIYSIERL